MDVNRIISGINQRCRKFFNNAQSNNIFVLMLHEVIQDEVSIYPSLAIKKESFIHLLDRIEETDARFVGVEKIRERATVNEEVKVEVVVTFDDVFENSVQNAIPILIDRGIPFTIFVSPSYVDKYGYIKSTTIRELANNTLCNIGYHTKDHTGMRFLKSLDEILSAADPTDFQQKFGIKCDYFAYPFGSVYMCPYRVRKMIEKINYKAAFGTIHSPINKRMVKKDRFYIPRLNVSDASVENIIRMIHKTVDKQ